MSEEEIFYSGN